MSTRPGTSTGLTPKRVAICDATPAAMMIPADSGR